MSLVQAAQRAQAWLSPLPGGSPFGVDVRNEPEHAAIRAEVAKLDSPAAASQIDWKRVADDGAALLASRSKDFLIAAYTAHALHEQESLPGLFAGVALLHGLLENAWEGMFPPPARIKGRVAALQWFIERASVRLSAASGTAPALRGGASGAGVAHAADDLIALRDAVTKLGELARTRFGADAPAMQPLLAALERVQLDAGAGGTAGAAVATAAAVDGAAVLQAALASATDAQSAPAATAAAAVAPAPAADAPVAQADAALTGEAAARAALREAIASWLEPIAADARAGKDARYDPLHEEARAMIKQLDSPSGQAPEWKKLVGHSEVLLKQRGKDLLIATYAAYGMHQQRSLTGLAEGLALVASLLDEYWDDLFPDMKRSQKARSGALAWLLSRFGMLGERALGPGDVEAMPRLSTAARWLAEVAATRFDDEHRPALRPFLEQIERLELAAQPAVEAPAAAATAAPQRAPAAAAARAADNSARGPAAAVAVPQATAAPSEVANRAEVARYLAGLHTALVDMGRALRKANPKDPLAYLLPRIGAALELDEVPPSNNGRTFVGAPNPMELQEIQSFVREQDWASLLAAAEAAAANHLFIFDLQRLVHTALKQLGAGYEGCALVVEGELAALLRRLPGLHELACGNGTPFADADTLAWIRKDILGGGPSAAASPGAGSGIDPDALASARALALSGNTGDALVAFDALLHGARSGRARFSIRLAMARAALAAGDERLAVGLFSALYDEIERRGLDEWEPELAADCLAGYHECLTRGHAGPEMAQRSAVVYARLCRVDPRRALKASQ